MHGLGNVARTLGALVLLAACPAASGRDDGAEGVGPTTLSPTSDGDTTQGTGPGSASQGATSSASADSGSGTTEGDETTGDAPFFDLGPIPDSPKLDMGCRKVDFLFVIDNSGSMSAQQVQLLASFDGFIQAIQASLEDSVDSYHVGVVTSDAYSSNAPGCNAIGSLVSQTAAGGDCTPFAEGGRFATEMDDLSVKFPCMAQVGTFGSGLEMPVTAAIAAVDPAINMPGACNDGFLRDDAILVLVVLTDDPPHDGSADDAHPMADTSFWYDAIVDAKNGDPEAMVVIGFVPYMTSAAWSSTSRAPTSSTSCSLSATRACWPSICERRLRACVRRHGGDHRHHLRELRSAGLRRAAPRRPCALLISELKTDRRASRRRASARPPLARGHGPVAARWRSRRLTHRSPAAGWGR